jgi:Flp pilus assembly protein TadD
MARRFGKTRSLGSFAYLLVVLVGCDATQQERVRLYNEDGIHLFSQGNYREAADSFEQALLLQPGDPVLMFNLGQSFDRAGRTPQAESYYLECLKRNPTMADARQAYANLLTRTGRTDNAHRLIEQWSAEEGNQSDALVLQAWKLRQENRFPEAQDKLHAALAQEPRNPRALTELGILYEKMNFPERSLVLYERVLEDNPNLFEVRERIRALKGRGVSRPTLDQ